MCIRDSPHIGGVLYPWVYIHLYWDDETLPEYKVNLKLAIASQLFSDGVIIFANVITFTWWRQHILGEIERLIVWKWLTLSLWHETSLFEKIRLLMGIWLGFWLRRNFFSSCWVICKSYEHFRIFRFGMEKYTFLIDMIDLPNFHRICLISKD